MIGRAAAWSWQLLLAVDQLLGCWLRGWGFVWTGGELPNADETISSWVGRRRLAGKRWARLAERAIDAILGAGHCRRAIEQLNEGNGGMGGYTFKARESVGYRTTLVVESGGVPVDITDWVFKASFQRQAGVTDFTLNMATSAAASDEGFWIIDGPTGLLQINIKPATLADIADTSGRFLMKADLLGTPPGGAREFITDINATILQGPTA